MSSRIYDIADRYVQRLAALNPLAATAMGIPGYDDQMTSPVLRSRTIGIGSRATS
jgi:hypothetical protein